MTSTKPSIVIVPGAWCPPAIYKDISEPLQGLGYEVHVVNHKTNQVPADPPPVFQDDVNQLVEVFRELTDAGKDVVCVLHSFGGYIGMEAAKGFGKEQRSAEGLPGGITRLLCMAALIPKVGTSPGEFLPEIVPFAQVVESLTGQQLPWISLAPEAKYQLWNDLPPEKADELGEHLVPISALVYQAVPTWPAYKHIPTMYLQAEQDFCAKETQKVFIEFMNEQTENSIEVIKVQAGHMPMNSKPEFVVSCIRKAAGEPVTISG